MLQHVAHAQINIDKRSETPIFVYRKNIEWLFLDGSQSQNSQLARVHPGISLLDF